MYEQGPHADYSTPGHEAFVGGDPSRERLKRVIRQDTQPVSTGKNPERSIVMGRIIEMKAKCHHAFKRRSRRMGVKNPSLS